MAPDDVCSWTGPVILGIMGPRSRDHRETPRLLLAAEHCNFGRAAEVVGAINSGRTVRGAV